MYSTWWSISLYFIVNSSPRLFCAFGGHTDSHAHAVAALLLLLLVVVPWNWITIFFFFHGRSTILCWRLLRSFITYSDSYVQYITQCSALPYCNVKVVPILVFSFVQKGPPSHTQENVTNLSQSYNYWWNGREPLISSKAPDKRRLDETKMRPLQFAVSSPSTFVLRTTSLKCCHATTIEFLSKELWLFFL